MSKSHFTPNQPIERLHHLHYRCCWHKINRYSSNKGLQHLLKHLHNISSSNLQITTDHSDQRSRQFRHQRGLEKHLHSDQRSRQKTSFFILFQVFYGRYREKQNFQRSFTDFQRGEIIPDWFPTKNQLKTGQISVKPGQTQLKWTTNSEKFRLKTQQMQEMF
jgi:hypothetical protein